MSQAILCIGLGEFGEQCLHQIQDWISPSAVLDNSTYRKFLEHNGDQWGFVSRSKKYDTHPFFLNDLTDEDPHYMYEFKETLLESLTRLVSTGAHIESTKIFVLMSGEKKREWQENTKQKFKKDHRRLLKIQYAIEEQIQKIGQTFSKLRGELRTPISQRNVHLHYVLSSPKLAMLNGLSPEDRMLTKTFLDNLITLDNIAQKVGPGCLSKVWVSSRFLSGAVLDESEAIAGSAALIRLICKPGLQGQLSSVNGQAFNHFESNLDPAAAKQSTRADRTNSILNLFLIGSASLPIGALYKYSLYRNLYDAFVELNARVNKPHTLQTLERKDLWEGLRPMFQSFIPAHRDIHSDNESLQQTPNVASELMGLAGQVSSRFGDRVLGEGGLYESQDKLGVNFGESAADIRDRYPNLYSPITTIVEDSDLEQFDVRIKNTQIKLDKMEASTIDNIRGTIEDFIENKCGKIHGLVGFGDTKEILQETQQKCYLDMFEWEKNVPNHNPMDGIDELVDATNNLPSKKDIYFTSFGIALLLMTVGSFFVSPMQSSSVSTTQLPTLADLWSSNVWNVILSLITCLVGGYLITQALFRNLYNTLSKILTTRRNTIQRFIKMGGTGPIAQQAFVSLEIRKERINRATLNHIIDLLGKMDAISQSMGQRMSEMESHLTNMKVKVHSDPEMDNISELVYDNYTLHTSLCAPNVLSKWASTCRIKGQHSWVSAVIAEHWPSEHIFSDIPVGDHKSLYKMAYANVMQIKTRSPLTQDRREESIKRCRKVLRACSNSFKLFCEPINHDGQPSPNKFDSGELYLAMSFGFRADFERMTADAASVPTPLIDESRYSEDDGTTFIQDEYMIFLNAWSNVHPEDILRGISDE